MSECFKGSELEKPTSLRKPMLIPSPDIWSECIALGETIVVLLDNFSINEWEHYIENIMTCARENSFIILTVNENEYENNQAQFRKYELFNKSHVFDLGSSTYLLSVNEKSSILTRHIQAHDFEQAIECQTEFCDVVAKDTPSVLFLEYIFTFFSANNKTYKLEKCFFERPLKFVKQMLESLKQSQSEIAKEKFAFLCKLYFNQNSIDFGLSGYPKTKETSMNLSVRKALLCSSDSPQTDPLTLGNFADLEVELRKRLKLEPIPPVNCLRRIAKSMDNIFVRFEDDTCTFSSDAVQMTIGVMLVEEFPEKLVALTDYELVHACFRPFHTSTAITQEGEDFLTYDVTPKIYESVSRILEDAILHGKVKRVLGHPMFREQDFVNTFFRHCKPDVLFSKDNQSQNSLLYHAVDVPVVDVVGQILSNKNWKGTKQKRSFKQVIKTTFKNDFSAREKFISEQNYKSLLKACKYGKIRDVEALTRSGTPVTQPCLVDGSISGKIEVVRLILGCIPKWSTTCLSQALFEACKSFSHVERTTDWGKLDKLGIPDVISFLHLAGGGPNVNLPGIGFPIRHAVETKDVSLLEILISIGADVNYKYPGGKNMLHCLLENGFDSSIAKLLLIKGTDLNWQDAEGQTPLHVAILQNTVGVVSLFINFEADINLQDRNGSTPLILASDLGYLPIVKVLVEYGAETTHRDISNETAVSKAVNKRHRYIIRYFASKNIIDEDSVFRLVLANDIELMSILRSAEFNWNFRRDDGTSLLEAATYNGFNDMVSLLLQRGADPNISVQNNHGLALYPVKTGNLKLFDILCRAGSDITAIDEEENSALHICCALGNVEFVVYIIDRQQGLIHSINNIGWNPVEYAAYCGRFDLTVKLNKVIHRKFRSMREKVCANLYRRAVEGYKLRSKFINVFVQTEIQFGSKADYMKLFDYL